MRLHLRRKNHGVANREHLEPLDDFDEEEDENTHAELHPLGDAHGSKGVKLSLMFFPN